MSEGQGLRDVIAAKLDGLDQARIDELIERLFDQTKDVYVACRACGVKTAAPVPDVANIAKALDLLLTQAKGKPVEHKRIEVEVGIRSLDTMTLDQLNAEEAAILEQHPELR